MASTTCELIWLKALLRDLGVKIQRPMKLYCDNQAAIHIASNPVFHERTKHIEVDCHFIRGKIQDGTIITEHVRSEEQLADIFTKATNTTLSNVILCKFGLIDIHKPNLRGNVKSNIATSTTLPRHCHVNDIATTLPHQLNLSKKPL